jgi:protein-tyrosine phosphatase
MAGRGAVLYHCTAGQDRTGTFSALLLTMLGVPRETVMQDYLLSNEYVATPARVNAMVARGATREAAIATIGVDRAYLDLMFTAIDKEYGSFEAYRRQALGISDADLAALKSKLLE